MPLIGQLSNTAVDTLLATGRPTQVLGGSHPADRNGPEIEDELEAALTAFFDGGFRRNYKGNLSRRWEGRTLTVFCRGDGRYGWSISSRYGVRFSEVTFDDELEAFTALWWQTEGSDWC